MSLLYAGVFVTCVVVVATAIVLWVLNCTDDSDYEDYDEYEDKNFWGDQ